MVVALAGFLAARCGGQISIHVGSRFYCAWRAPEAVKVQDINTSSPQPSRFPQFQWRGVVFQAFFLFLFFSFVSVLVMLFLLSVSSHHVLLFSSFILRALDRFWMRRVGFVLLLFGFVFVSVVLSVLARACAPVCDDMSVRCHQLQGWSSV